MVAPLPRRVTPVIRRAVDDLVAPAPGRTPDDAVPRATRRAADGPVAPAPGRTPDDAAPRATREAGGDPVARAGGDPLTPAAPDDAATPVARGTPGDWSPR